MRNIFPTILFFFPVILFAQKTDKSVTFKKHIHRADSAYKANNFLLCGAEYELAFQNGQANFIHYFKATKCFAMEGNADKGFKYLNKSVETNWQFTCEWFEKEEKLNSLKIDPRWEEISKKCEKIKGNFNEPLRDELVKFRNEYQALRTDIPAKNDEKYGEYSLKILDFNRRSTARMKEIINDLGWPKTSQVGEVGAHAAWLLVQHADTDPVFQEKCLKLVEEAFKTGEASGTNYAFLYDRVKVNKGEKQLYGTQIRLNENTKLYEFQPIENEHLLDERRTKIGLQWNAKEYAYVVGFNYKPVNEEVAFEKSKNDETEYENLISNAQKAFTEKDYEKAVSDYKYALTMNGNLKTAHLIEGAKAVVKSKEKDKSVIFLWLKMAVARGWKDVEELQKSKPMRSVKSDSGWEMLKNMAGN